MGYQNPELGWGSGLAMENKRTEKFESISLLYFCFIVIYFVIEGQRNLDPETVKDWKIIGNVYFYLIFSPSDIYCLESNRNY